MSEITRADMSNVVVKKDVLLEKLRENRESHKTDYEAAIVGYWLTAAEEVGNALDKIAEKTWKGMINLPLPVEHLEDYDRTIEALSMSVFDEVELTITEFNQYVRDQWTWKQAFTASTAAYNNR